MREFKLQKLVVAGGVARNSALRQSLQRLSDENNLELFIPSGIFCTDNAAMIGKIAQLRLNRGERSSLSLSPTPNLSLNTIKNVA